MVFISQVRWHLGTIMGVIQVGDGAVYGKICGANQDALMSAIKLQPDNAIEGTRAAVLNAPMITVITDEGLRNFFTEELEQAVSVPQCRQRGC